MGREIQYCLLRQLLHFWSVVLRLMLFG